MGSKHIVLLLALAAAGAMVPDVPSAVQMVRENPELGEVVFACYAVFALLIVYALISHD